MEVDNTIKEDKGEIKSENKKVEKEKQKISITQLFRHADWIDVLLIIVGTLGAAAHGLVLPSFSIIFGDLTNALTKGPTAIYDAVVRLVYYFLIIGAGGCIVTIVEYSAWGLTAERQSSKIKEKLLKSILRQEIGWFDKIGTGELTTRILSDTIVVHDGLDKFGIAITNICQFIAGFIIGFIDGWRLTLVMLAVTPVLTVTVFLTMKFIALSTTRAQKSYAVAGVIATEAISSIRTVASFNGEERIKKTYNKFLETAKQQAIRGSSLAGFGFGVTNFSFFGFFAIALWYGSEEVLKGKMSGGDVMTVMFSVIMGAAALGKVGPCTEQISKAGGVIIKLNEIIDRKSNIDVTEEKGLKSDKIKGKFEFKDVKFCYPSRPETQIMNGLNLKIRKGKTTALVGPSGSGKSSTVSLIQRFYDPDSGEITFDGKPLNSYNVKWLREQISIVSQEPVLFSGTIAENIAYGKKGCSQEEVENAAKASNAHNFIMDFPNQYNTQVGEKGTQLSGGQKQRIAIARAIIKNPKILLLDEATSALDNESEKIVQQALDSVMKGRTTIVIAHRLSTIQDADKIVVINKGRVEEEGSHKKLMKIEGGIYANLVKLQQVNNIDTNEKNDNQEKNNNNSNEKEVTIQVKVEEKETGSINKEKEDDDKLYKVSNWRLFGYTSREWPFYLVAAIAAAINGSAFPVFSIVFAEMIFLYYQPLPGDEFRRKSGNLSGAMVGIGIAPLVFHTLLMFMVAIIAQRFVKKIRKMTFEAILRQDISFFDQEKNKTGILTGTLASEVTLVGNMIGPNFANGIQLIFTAITGFVIAFYYGWKMTLVVLAASPALLLGDIMENISYIGYGSQNAKLFGEANQIAQESIGNMRTVVSFTQEDDVYHKYAAKLEKPKKTSSRKALMKGFFNGISIFSMMGMYAVSFWYGAKLIKSGEYNFLQVMKVFIAIAMTSTSVGQSSALMTDLGKSKLAASSVFKLIDRRPKIVNKPDGLTPNIDGSVEFENVRFNYPERPHIRVMNKMSFKLEAGKVMALVGASGSGKSSVVSLIERFYDPNTLDTNGGDGSDQDMSGEDAGVIRIDGIPIKDISLNHLRQQIALVGQEPVLFSGTIAENIAWGKEGSSQEEIINAAKAANAHNFIESFPDKYNTQVGEKGAQLSGGQKQRIAIARGIIKNPKILLLDEATSALDTESEKVVQEALESVMKGRTTIIIAHRLSTIQHADVIAVVKDGRIVESGTHDQLLSLNGAYSRLQKKKSDKN